MNTIHALLISCGPFQSNAFCLLICDNHFLLAGWRTCLLVFFLLSAAYEVEFKSKSFNMQNPDSCWIFIGFRLQKKRNQQILKFKAKQRNPHFHEYDFFINSQSIWAFFASRFVMDGKMSICGYWKTASSLSDYRKCDSFASELDLMVSTWLGSYVKNLILFRGKLHKELTQLWSDRR